MLEDAKPFVLAKPLEMGQPLHKMVSFDWYSIGKKTEEAGMDKGIYLPYSSRALITPFIIICWIFSLACLACTKILRVQLVRIILENGIIFYSLLVVFMICGYYINEIFLFKNDKYGIYVVSLIVQLATFYLLLNSA